MTKLPKAISKANMPMMIEMISKAVIRATSPLMYSGGPGTFDTFLAEKYI